MPRTRRGKQGYVDVWLPCPVDEEQVEAELKNGILRVRLPKSEEAKKRKITVKG